MGRAAAQKGRAPEKAAAAFKQIIPVLRHPRCMNCHSTGDYPRQGDDSHAHIMQVRRGSDGHGPHWGQVQRLSSDSESRGLAYAAGRPGWHLPPAYMPMIWEGLTDRRLCELLKDPNQNGHKTIQQIVEHMATPLVLWGWHPGEGRTPIPTPLHRFLAGVKEWAANGAGMPRRTISRRRSGN